MKRLLLFLASCSMLNVANAAYLVLTTSLPKCVIINSLKGSKIAIHYESPDIQLEEGAVGRAAQRSSGSGAGAGIEDPESIMKEMNGRSDRRDNMHLDEMYERQRQMMERSMQGMVKENYLTITEVDDSYKEKGFNPNMRSGQRDVLVNSRGSIKYEMKTFNRARICIQRYSATPRTPFFISMIIRDVFELPKPEKPKKNPEDEKVKKIVDNHLKYVERELYMMLQLTDRLLDGSTQSKLSHSSLKDVLVQMHRKFKWFSILQIVITLVAGIFYLKSLMAFLKKRRIIY